MALTSFKMDSGAVSAERLPFFILITTIISVAAQAILIISSFGKLPPQIPLYFGRAWGNKMLASPKEIWILPAGLCIVFIINWVIAKQLKQSSDFLVKILMVFTLIFSICSLLATLKIITLVA